MKDVYIIGMGGGMSKKLIGQLSNDNKYNLLGRWLDSQRDYKRTLFVFWKSRKMIINSKS